MEQRFSEVEEDNAKWDKNSRLGVGESSGSDAAIRKLSYPPRDKHAAPVPFQQPSQLISFSYTPARELEFADSALRYYVHPPVNADLRYGYERWIKRPEEKGRLDGLLKAIAKYRTRIDGDSEPGSGDAWLRSISVVSWRGVMTKLLTAPYEDREGWELNVMCVNGTMYFEEHLSNEKLRQKENMTPHHRLQSYYGYAFESYCTSTIPDQREPSSEGDLHVAGWGGDVDTNVQWCSIVKTKLGNDRLVIGGEVDCVRGKYTGKPDKFVELKTSLTIRGPQDEANFEKKLLKFYFQSFLLGVPEIVVGFRKPSGQLTTVQSFQTIQIPRLVRGKQGAWDPSICLKWGEDFMRFLKPIVIESRSQPVSIIRDSAEQTKQPELHVWRAKFTLDTGVSVVRLDKAGVEEVQAGDERVGFLPRWYLEKLGVISEAGHTSPSVNSSSRTPPVPATGAQAGGGGS